MRTLHNCVRVSRGGFRWKLRAVRATPKANGRLVGDTAEGCSERAEEGWMRRWLDGLDPNDWRDQAVIRVRWWVCRFRGWGCQPDIVKQVSGTEGMHWGGERDPITCSFGVVMNLSRFPNECVFQGVEIDTSL